MVTRFIKAISLSIPAVFAMGCASIHTPQTYGLDTDSAALVRQTCNDVMGLKVGPEYEACGGSLAQTVRVLQDARLTAQGDRECEQRGFAQGTPELAKCVVEYRRAGHFVPAKVTLPTTADAQPWQSYFSMSDAQRIERAELSCAQLGLHPAWGAFNYCVTDLRQSIVNIRDLSFTQ